HAESTLLGARKRMRLRRGIQPARRRVQLLEQALAAVEAIERYAVGHGCMRKHGSAAQRRREAAIAAIDAGVVMGIALTAERVITLAEESGVDAGPPAGFAPAQVIRHTDISGHVAVGC